MLAAGAASSEVGGLVGSDWAVGRRRQRKPSCSCLRQPATACLVRHLSEYYYSHTMNFLWLIIYMIGRYLDGPYPCVASKSEPR